MPIRAVITCFLGLACIALTQRLVFARYYSEDVGQIGSHLSRIIYWGLRFDAAVAAFLTASVTLLVYVATRFTQTPYLNSFRRWTGLAGSLLLALFALDGAYYSWFLRHADARIFETTGPLIDLGIDWVFGHWPLFLVQIFSLSLLLAYLYRVYPPQSKPASFSIRYVWWPEVRLLLVLVTSLILIRGGLQSSPLKPIHAYGIGNKLLLPYTQSGAYQLLYTSIKSTHLEAVPLPINLEHVRDYIPLLPRLNQRPISKAAFKPFNIIFLLLNQWPTTYMASYGFGKSTTPFFDQLRQQSLSAATMLAGSERPEESLFSSLCSAQAPLEGRIADSQLHQLNFQCLPDLLRQRGYQTLFVQGSGHYVGELGSVAQFVGFEATYSVKDVERRQYGVNASGVHDPDLYHFALQQMDNSPAPFAIAIHTNSTASTQLPANWIGEFPVQEKRDETLNIVNFADYALQNFVEALQQKSYAHNTLLVILGDRALAGDPVSTPLLNAFSVPFAIYAPRLVNPRMVDVVAGPRDIAPTILDILALPTPAHYVGHSLLNPGKQPFFADYYQRDRLGWIEAKSIVEFSLQDPNQVKCYTYRANAVPATLACKMAATDAVQRALGFTATAQQLLLQGQLEQFETIKLRN